MGRVAVSAENARAKAAGLKTAAAELRAAAARDNIVCLRFFGVCAQAK